MKFISWLRPRPALSGPDVLAVLTEFTYLAAIFAVPIWFAYWFPTHNIFELNKLVVLQALTALFLALTLLSIIFYPVRLKLAPGIFLKKYWLVPLIFIVGLLLLLIFSVNPILSFYGQPDRQGGLVSYLWYFLWFILLSFNLLNRPDRVRRAIMTAALAGTLVAVYAILQILNIDFLTWPEPAYLTGRAFSTFGQPNFLASWLLLIIPLSGYLFWTARRTGARLGWVLAGLTQLAALFFTGSRGGLVALIFVGLLFGGGQMFKSGWPGRKKFSLAGVFLLVVILGLAIFNALAPGRLRQSLDFNYGSTGARANFYRAAGLAIPERFLVGYGFDSGEDIFIKYYEPDWAVFGSVGQSADRAHNLILDLWLNAGLLGVGLFFLLYYFFFRLGRDNLRQPEGRSLSWALILGASAYLFSLLFSFSFVAGEMYFWLFLAVAVALNFNSRAGSLAVRPVEPLAPAGLSPVVARQAKGDALDTIPKFIIAAVGLFLAGSLIYKAGQTLVADYYFARIYDALIAKDYFTMLVIDGYERGTATNPVNQASYDYHLADQLSDLYPSIWELTPQSVVRQKLVELDRKIVPAGYKNLLVKAKINLALKNLPAAASYFVSVIDLTPHWPLAYLVGGEIAAQGGNYPAALANYQLAQRYLPDVSDQRLNDQHRQEVKNYHYFINKKIADIYFQQKDYESAGKYYQSAYIDNPDDFSLLKNIADTFYLRGDRPTAIIYVRHGLSRNPADYHWPLALAALYFEAGDSQTASIYLQAAKKLAPESAEIQALEKKYNP